eukprot:CAMPEP_0119111028 /NCGR_PEP_ID=MMETSP1180-20130426/33407_1 /TAXON_ID=3052 ORGANISM="Chlamydomonas cf sp, Strain CCMP681" /NCGR_SAMPLE_ID=MMETSP1180 /ASSEMBLY_ACC=CAM_ASM_000741 /LENGTH=34 /DNA_ID= /DNA_START= /DNA_END= /DNA_ORIENTATION=
MTMVGTRATLRVTSMRTPPCTLMFISPAMTIWPA